MSFADLEQRWPDCLLSLGFAERYYTAGCWQTSHNTYAIEFGYRITVQFITGNSYFSSIRFDLRKVPFQFSFRQIR